MKKLPLHIYADVLLKVLEKQSLDADGVIRRFTETLKKRNDWSRRFKIIDAFEQKLRAKNGTTLVSIESARPLTESQRSAIETRWKTVRHIMRYAVNPSLIAGVKIIINNEYQLDGSLAKKFQMLFSKL